MEYLRKIKRELLAVILIIVLASILRFLWLDKIPIGITSDELTYIFNAKAIFLTGSDISGTWNPLSVMLFHYPAYTTPQAELPYFLLTPVVGFLQFSLFNARITFAFLSVLTVLFIYLIAKELFGKRVGTVAGLVAAFNPWLIYIGRTDYEMVPATLFFLIGIYVLLKAKSWKILWSIPILYLAFYSYIATKLIFIPIILVVITYCYFVNKKFLKQYLVVLISSVLPVFIYALILKQDSNVRLNEIFTPNAPILINQVDAIRQITMQTPLKNIFDNKITEYLMMLFLKLFNTTSFSYLFLTGDNFFPLIRHGLFYILDAAFLLFGLAAAYKKSAKIFFLLISLSFIAILPHVFHSERLENFTPHITLLFPFAIILIAIGIDETLNLFKNKWVTYIISALIFLLYTLFFLNFLNIYLFQFPLQGNFDFPVRLLSKYTALASENKQPIIIYSPGVPDTFRKYIFYTNNYNKNTASLIRSAYKTNQFNFGNIQILGCNNTIDPTKTKSTIIYDFNCGALKNNYKRVVIPRLSDGGQSYDIFNDKTCKDFSLKGYPSNLKISDFAIESLSKQQFCETFITNP